MKSISYEINVESSEFIDVQYQRTFDYNEITPQSIQSGGGGKYSVVFNAQVPLITALMTVSS